MTRSKTLKQVREFDALLDAFLACTDEDMRECKSPLPLDDRGRSFDRELGLENPFAAAFKQENLKTFELKMSHREYRKCFQVSRKECGCHFCKEPLQPCSNRYCHCETCKPLPMDL